MSVPLIRVDDVDDICVLICFLIYSLGCPLSKSQLAEITSFENAVNYFDLSEALEKVSGNLCIESDVDGETVYANMSDGKKVAREMGASLPLSIREKLFSEAVRVYTRDAMKKKGTFLSVHYIRNIDNTCTVGITVMDETTARKKYYIEVTAANEREADAIKHKISGNSRDFVRYLDSYFEE